VKIEKNLIHNLIKVLKNPVVSTTGGFLLFLFVAATLMFAVEHQAENPGFDSFFHSLWFSIITITTVGYGDISPTSLLGQGLTIFIVFVGIGYSGVLTGGITSWLVERSRRKELGQVPLKNVEGKFMVCGWKPNMRDLLKDILTVTGGKSSDLVLLNQMDPAEVQALRKDSELEHFHYYSGDDTNFEDLQKAGTSVMGTVMVLADTLPGKSDEEIDFKSVVTAHEVERCNDSAYQIVELNLQKFTPYLKQAKVEEVILNRDYAQILVCNLALMSGLYSVVKSFFSLEHGLVDLEDLSPKQVGQSYGELKQHRTDVVVIGLLENVGKISERKEERLEEVLRSVSIHKAIVGLNGLKDFASNEPLLHPPDSYEIKSNSSLLLLRLNPGDLNLPQEGRSTQGVLQQKAHSQLIRNTLEEDLLRADTWKIYFELLENQGIEFVFLDDSEFVVEYAQERYTFPDLQLGEAFGAELIKRYEQVVRVDDVEEVEVTEVQLEGPKQYVAAHPLIRTAEHGLEVEAKQLLILGWKAGLIEMLHYLVAHQEESYVRWRGITVVAQIGLEEQQLFAQHFADHPGLKLVLGDVTNREVLLKAGIMNTKKVLVLAETGRSKTLEEIDSQSVLACMQVSDLNKRAYLTAEFLNKKYLEAMIDANVEECFLVDEFNNLILANGSTGRGMSNVIRDLTNQRDNLLEIHGIEHRFIGNTFGELCESVYQEGQMVLGLLEEAGNMYVRKAENIRQAQVKPNIKESVAELKLIKEMGANHVVLAPKPGHIIKKHSRLIRLNTSRPGLWRDEKDRHST